MLPTGNPPLAPAYHGGPFHCTNYRGDWEECDEPEKCLWNKREWPWGTKESGCGPLRYPPKVSSAFWGEKKPKSDSLTHRLSLKMGFKKELGFPDVKGPGFLENGLRVIKVLITLGMLKCCC